MLERCPVRFAFGDGYVAHCLLAASHEAFDVPDHQFGRPMRAAVDDPAAQAPFGVVYPSTAAPDDWSAGWAACRDLAGERLEALAELERALAKRSRFRRGRTLARADAYWTAAELVRATGVHAQSAISG